MYGGIWKMTYKMVVVVSSVTLMSRALLTIRNNIERLKINKRGGRRRDLS